MDRWRSCSAIKISATDKAQAKGVDCRCMRGDLEESPESRQYIQAVRCSAMVLVNEDDVLVRGSKYLSYSGMKPTSRGEPIEHPST